MSAAARCVRDHVRVTRGLVCASIVAALAATTARAAEPPPGPAAPKAVQIANPTGPYVFGNAAPITVNDNGPATPYPSTIVVSGTLGFMSDLQVRINGLTHTFPADLDLLLVDPSGNKFVLMSDVGTGIDANNVSITFDDHAIDPLPHLSALTTGRFRPRDYTPADAFGGPAPAGPYGEPFPTGDDTLYSTFHGFSPNGTWSLYVVDDSDNDTGTIAGGWSLIMTDELLYGGGAITINDNAVATPYPSTVSVAGLPHKVLDVKLVLGGFTHSCPADVDMLLVAPNGRAFVALSDAGGCTPGVTGRTFTLEDQADLPVPLSTAVAPLGAYQAANYGTLDTFPAPAPAAPYRTAQPVGADGFDGAFDGVDPNGVWSLYVVDDASGDSGGIAFWNLLITTQAEFSSLSPVAINDVSAASPYPVVVNVSDVPGTLKRAYLRVNGLTHSFADDIDVLMTAPNGRAFVAQSDAGGGVDVNNITYTLDDDALTPIPDTAALIDTAVYQPANYGSGDTFPAGAPQAGVAEAAPGGVDTFASVFGGGPPNGPWRIFIVDDSSGDSGSIANGFTLGVETIYEFVFRDGFDD